MVNPWNMLAGSLGVGVIAAIAVSAILSLLTSEPDKTEVELMYECVEVKKGIAHVDRYGRLMRCEIGRK